METPMDITKLKATLERVAEGNHAPDCRMVAVPIDECACTPSVTWLAQVALDALNREYRSFSEL